MGTAIKHPVQDWVKSSFVIFDIRALWRSTVSVKSARMSKITSDVLPVWQQWASNGEAVMVTCAAQMQSTPSRPLKRSNSMKRIDRMFQRGQEREQMPVDRPLRDDGPKSFNPDPAADRVKSVF